MAYFFGGRLSAVNPDVSLLVSSLNKIVVTSRYTVRK